VIARLAMRQPLETTGFRPPSRHPLGRERRTVLFAELVATVGLALSTIIAATVLSVGIARASAGNGIMDVVDNEAAVFGIALLLGLLFVTMGGFSILPGGKARDH